MNTTDESKRKQTLSCGCFIYRENAAGVIEVLLVKPFAKRDMWGVPKGHIDPGETPHDCARREVLEETGIEVAILGEELPNCYTKNGLENKTVRTFMAIPSSDDYTLGGDGENAEMGWFPLDSLPIVHKYQVDMIAAGIARLKGQIAIPVQHTDI